MSHPACQPAAITGYRPFLLADGAGNDQYVAPDVAIVTDELISEHPVIFMQAPRSSRWHYGQFRKAVSSRPCKFHLRPLIPIFSALSADTSSRFWYE